MANANTVRVRRVIDGRIYERRVRRGGWLTTDEVVRLIPCSRRQVFYLIERGVLHPRKVDRRLRFALAEVIQVCRQRGGGTDVDEAGAPGESRPA